MHHVTQDVIGGGDFPYEVEILPSELIIHEKRMVFNDRKRGRGSLHKTKLFFANKVNPDDMPGLPQFPKGGLAFGDFIGHGQAASSVMFTKLKSVTPKLAQRAVESLTS